MNDDSINEKLFEEYFGSLFKKDKTLKSGTHPSLHVPTSYKGKQTLVWLEPDTQAASPVHVESAIQESKPQQSIS